ncbi:MAG TPA: oligosaccharide flippase family protein [Candidatus Bathyarchaeia archaeon]|nr:oligosaccharide flippase family protein [Candidatus Bathyarchaeia archaeon]
MNIFKEKARLLARRIVHNQLVRGSMILFCGSMIGNISNYVYHLLMGRMLGPSNYGALESVISLVYYLGIPLAGINLVVVKKVSQLRGEGKEKEISFFYQYITSKMFLIGFLGLIVISCFSIKIKNFLHLDSNWPILAIMAYSFVGIFIGINSAVLNAFYRFLKVSFLGILQAGIKLVSAVVLVSLGWQVIGASGAFLIGSILALGLSFFYLKKIVKFDHTDRIGRKSENIFRDMVPFFVSSVAFTSLYTTDLVLARHFLPATEAGLYAALSVLGKIIFFASGPVGQVMFPMVSNRQAAGVDYRRLFMTSLFLVLLVSLGISGVYFFFPDLMVNILFGGSYLAASKYLIIFALFLTFYSLASVTAQFFLSISKNETVVLSGLAAFCQAVYIFFFHQDIVQIVSVSAIICGLLFLSFMIYFFKNCREGFQR